MIEALASSQVTASGKDRPASAASNLEVDFLELGAGSHKNRDELFQQL